LEFQRFLTSYWNRPHKKTAENSQNRKNTSSQPLHKKRECDQNVKNRKKNVKKT
jgi:hypothetical protein